LVFKQLLFFVTTRQESVAGGGRWVYSYFVIMYNIIEVVAIAYVWVTPVVP
jgi:hypothetical protein